MADIDEKAYIVNPISDEVGDREEFSYENFVSIRRGTVNVHWIIGDSTPIGVTTWDNAPLGSIFTNSAGGDDATFFIKEATGATGWAAATTGVAG